MYVPDFYRTMCDNSVKLMDQWWIQVRGQRRHFGPNWSTVTQNDPFVGLLQPDVALHLQLCPQVCSVVWVSKK